MLLIGKPFHTLSGSTLARRKYVAIVLHGWQPSKVLQSWLVGGQAHPKLISWTGYVPLSAAGAELLFEVFSQRYERGATLVTSNLPFDEWTSVFGSERLTGALLDRLTHHVHILEMNGDSYRLAHSKRKARKAKAETPTDSD